MVVFTYMLIYIPCSYYQYVKFQLFQFNLLSDKYPKVCRLIGYRVYLNDQSVYCGLKKNLDSYENSAISI